MAIPDYLSLTSFKLRTGSDCATYDPVLTEILESVGAAISAYLGFDPEVVNITEYLDCNGAEFLTLKRWPVEAITSVCLDTNTGLYGQNLNSFPTNTELEQGVGYVWSIPNGSTVGKLLRVNQSWPFKYVGEPLDLAYLRWYDRGCVQVQYVVDNTALLLACRQAAYLEGAAQFRSMATGMGAVLSEQIDGYSISVTPFQKSQVGASDSADGFISPQAAGLLRPWRLSRLV